MVSQLIRSVGSMGTLKIVSGVWSEESDVQH